MKTMLADPNQAMRLIQKKLLAELKITDVRELATGKQLLETIDPQTGGLQVPIKIEVSFEGKTEVMEEKPVVRQVYGQPGRWIVINF